MKDFVGDFTNEITERFKPGSPYDDVTPSPSKSLMESSMEYFRQ
jgi:hypothetical protein